VSPSSPLRDGEAADHPGSMPGGGALSKRPRLSSRGPSPGTRSFSALSRGSSGRYPLDLHFVPPGARMVATNVVEALLDRIAEIQLAPGSHMRSRTSSPGDPAA